jgi:hypothetical protein
MSALLASCSLLVIALVMFDGFETMLLPRRMTRSFRFTRYFFLFSWRPWRAIARRVPAGRRREGFLSAYGPLSMVVLFGLWATALIIGFAVLHQAIGSPLNTPGGARDPLDYFYMSGVTFFTLGFGDVTPASPLGRMIAVFEAGIGFGFLAAVIGYLPVLYAAFSRREVTISLLDARAGSPPTAAQALLRIGPTRHADTLGHFLVEWERWAGEVLESHLSFPVLTYYRSQHDNQSWLAALTAVLDTCAIVIARLGEVDPYQAQLTFAMARHAVVDLSQIYSAAPRPADTPRLTEAEDLRLVEALRASGFEVRDDERATAKCTELRAMYEPFLDALARHFVLRLPPIMPEAAVVDNWQTSAWMQRTVGIGRLALQPVFDDGHDN